MSLKSRSKLDRRSFQAERSRHARAAVKAAAATPATSVYRCAECGDGTRLYAWTHVVAHGPVSAKGVIDHYDWTDDDDDVIEESIICSVHGEGFVEKLIDGLYSSAMVDGRYVSPTVELATALLNESDVKWDVRHRELYNLALRISGRAVRPMAPEDIARFEELAEARVRQAVADDRP
ncbi:hypothetical protein [Sphaerimonospora mesophila]|uniref:hypothetical protein n=1 Tax=Sphaerimonospora mesophila TaxID=37483 RepID=UPI000A5B582C